MPHLRQRLAWVLRCWLVLQFAGIVAPLALVAAGRGSTEDVCTCPGGGHGAVCPMHHGERPGAPATDEREDPRRCVMRSALANSDLALLSLAAGGGLLPRPLSICAPGEWLDVAPANDVDLLSRAPLPVAPPPRA